MHRVQGRVISVVNFFVLLRLLYFALLLLYVTYCALWKPYFAFLMCYQHLEIFISLVSTSDVLRQAEQVSFVS